MRRVGAGRAGRLAPALAGSLAVLWGAGAAWGQTAPRVIVTREPEAGVVAVAVRVAGGSADDPVGQSGRTQLAALAALETVRTGLDSLDAHADAECGRTATGFLLLAPPDTWQTAAQRFVAAIFTARPDSGAIARARRRLAHSTQLENGNPTWQVRLVTRQALYGIVHPWTRPRCGVPETIEQIPDSAIVARARSAFRPQRAAAAVNGPVDTLGAGRLFDEWLGAAAPAAEVEEAAPGDSVRTAERNTVTAWAGLAFPVTESVDREALRMVAFLIQDATRPGPDRPGLLGSSVEIEWHEGRGALFVYLVTGPEDVHAWLQRVRDLVRRYAAAPLPEGVFRRDVRRFRGIRLRQLDTPDARARRNAADLLAGLRPVPPAAAIDALDPRRVQRAAAALGPPARGVVGPARVVNTFPG